MNLFSRSKPTHSFAAGYPETTLVTASRNKRLGDNIMLVNGTNAFCVPSSGFQSIRLTPSDGGVFQLVGKGQAGTETVLGMFGNAQAGQNAHAVLMRQYAGIKAQAASSGLWKWALGALLLVAAMATFSRGAPAGAAGEEPDLAQMKAAVTAHMQKAAPAGGFDPNEPSLDQGAAQSAAAGAYNFGGNGATAAAPSPTAIPTPAQQMAGGRPALNCAEQK